MDVGVDDIFIGNGVSELIMMAMQGLLDTGDEVLVPGPDYPLWTAAITLSGGKAVHYLCDEDSLWNPDLEDLRSKVTDRTKAIVVINPNNPTGAVYERKILEDIAQLAAERELIVFADEIYDKIIYDGATHIPMATINPDILTISFNGLSKAYRAAGFRSGWMVLSGNKNSPGVFRWVGDAFQYAALCQRPRPVRNPNGPGGYQSIKDLVLPGGRLKEQRDVCVSMVNSIPGLSVVKPQGALYCFPKIERETV